MGLEALGPWLIVLALALMAVSPLHLTIVQPRPEPQHAALVLREACPPSALIPDIDRLVLEVDRALAADPLISATAQIADTYDHA